MKIFRRIFSLLFTALVAVPLSALDVSSVKQSGMVKHGRSWEQSSEFESPARDGARLVVRAESGVVVIHPAAGNKVTCAVVLRAYTPDEATARNLFDKFQLNAHSAETGSVYLSSQTPGPARHGSSLRVEFQLTVPQKFNLDVETQGGDITVDAPLDGEARLTTAGGDVRTSDVMGIVHIETAGGKIETGNVGGELAARTAAGSIHVGDVKGDAVLETTGGEIITGQVAGGVRAETAGGDVIVAAAGGRLVARTAGGQIQIGPTSGSVVVDTAGGSIRLRGARGRVVAETAGGSIDLLQIEGSVQATTAVGRILAEINCDKKSCGASELETSMGDVLVYLTGNEPLTIDASISTAAGHQITSDFPLDIHGNNEDLTPSILRGFGSLNGGGEVLKIRTVAGNIEIHKIDTATALDLQKHEQDDWNASQSRKAGKAQRRQLRHGGGDDW